MLLLNQISSQIVSRGEENKQICRRTMPIKWCPRQYHEGDRWVSTSEFYKDSRNPDGLDNRCKTCQKTWKKKWYREQRVNNPQYKIKKNISRRMRSALNAPKGKSTAHEIGSSTARLQVHIERQFHEYMTWSTRHRWHIDHRIPVTAFDLTSPVERAAAFHFLNLQPMWGEDNIRKSNKYNLKDKQDYMKRWREHVFG